MITLQIVSSMSGTWNVERLPTGVIRAEHEDVMGDEEDPRIIDGLSIDDLMDSIRQYDKETEEEQ